jgi:hypothetical protein
LTGDMLYLDSEEVLPPLLWETGAMADGGLWGAILHRVCPLY